MTTMLTTVTTNKSENMKGALYLPKPKETKEMKWFDDTQLLRKPKIA